MAWRAGVTPARHTIQKQTSRLTSPIRLLGFAMPCQANGYLPPNLPHLAGDPNFPLVAQNQLDVRVFFRSQCHGYETLSLVVNVAVFEGRRAGSRQRIIED